MLIGNKGEWSEFYAFCYLLSHGVLQAADKDLNPLDNIYFPIIKIIREEVSGKKMCYYPGDIVKVYRGEELYGEYPRVEFCRIVDKMMNEIPKGQRAFEIPEADAFAKRINVYKLKADSTHKEDICIQLHDIYTGIFPVCGFSIKSYLGGNPTLVNAGKNTNFVYEVLDCDDSIMNRFNCIETKQKLIDRIDFLQEKGCILEFADILSSGQFRTNLKFIDTQMPKLIAEALQNFYTSGVASKKIKDVIKELSAADVCGFEEPKMYEYKMKLFLCACALGMTPESVYDGGEDANGGYITVKKDGSVVCYHIYNRTDFYQYLFDYTYFEKGSSTRHDYMRIYKSGGAYYMNLNLQIRFCG